jgi:hypothetical protein
LGLEAAGLLHYLIDYCSELPIAMRVGGWFCCPSSLIERGLEIPVEAQTRLLNRLMAEGVIETKRMGLPAKRHIRIKWESVNEMIAKWAVDQMKSVNPKEGENEHESNSRFHDGRIQEVDEEGSD